MMWIAIYVLLMIIVLLLLRNASLANAMSYEHRRANREASLRAATEIAFCVVVQEQIGDRLQSNMQRVSETTLHFDKTRSDGRGPN